MRQLFRPLLLPVLLALLAPLACAQSPAELEQGFTTPPPSARPHTWWHWLNGNASAEGITLDLEAMKRVGIGGVQLFNVSEGVPDGPAPFMSEQWHGLVQHAIKEADRLGLEVCLHNCAGWSSSGGPWVTPELAMQMVTAAEVRVAGPLTRPLPQPPSRRGFYRDIAVLAFPTPPAEKETLAECQPRITCSLPGVDFSKALDGDQGSSVTLTAAPTRPVTVDFVLAKPLTVRSLWLLGAPRGGARVELQAADDKGELRAATTIGVPEPNVLRPPSTVGFTPVTSSHYRLVVTGQGGSAALTIWELRLGTGALISNLGPKAGYDRGGDTRPGPDVAGAEALVKPDSILDVTDRLGADGTLNWQPPAGQWSILRLGYTVTGKENHPSPKAGLGLECDKLSRESADSFFTAALDRIIKEAGPLAGKALKNVLIDSYEVDCQNWTPKMREEFKRLRGYDPLKYLPVLIGRVVESTEASERFLWDYRRTLADLFAQNYYGRFAELAHERGLLLSSEPYGNGNFDDLQAGMSADIPMTEFWIGSNSPGGAKMVASVAHTNGRKCVGAESFTAAPDVGRWLNHPAQLKPLGDLMYTGGINRYIFHCYAHQPWKDLVPGMTMGQWGTHFSRTNTWWEQSAGWMQYLARCQYLLQSGLFAADLCYLQTGDSPAGMGISPGPPAGYDFDGCTEETLARFTVRDGRLVLPDGMSYRVLVLPGARVMSPGLLRRLRQLITDGATVVAGAPPTGAPGLQGFPQAEAEVKSLVGEIWGDCDGKQVTQRALGKGRLVRGRPLEEVLGVPPDVRTEAQPEARICWIHRTVGEAEVYFVCNPGTRPTTVSATFRVAGKLPELWHADTGRCERAPLYRADKETTTVTLPFEPADSVFVVFRQPLPAGPSLVNLTRDGQPAWQPAARKSAHRLEIVEAVYGVLDSGIQDCVDVTGQVRQLVKEGALTVTASNALAGDPAQNIVKQMRVEYVYNGTAGVKVVDENATLKLPEKPAAPGTLEIKRALYGVLPAEGAPEPAKTTVDVTKQLAERVKDGVLSVVAGNDLAGDPANMIVKQLRVAYRLDGKAITRTYRENQTIELPDARDLPNEPLGPPTPRVSVDAGGRARVTTWQAGEFAAETSGGSGLKQTVAALPPVRTLTGPWTLRFPAGSGAPAQAAWPQLVSWSTSDNAEIRYFSGTATYSCGFEAPAEWLAPDAVPVLDLGTVYEIARVTVNGKDAGLLWRLPFRADLTGLLKAGQNTLEVQVTNLWPNRLIGDEQYPDDVEGWSNRAIPRWPQWLPGGVPSGPRPGPRRSFTVFKHWHKDDPLQESGLLGPVSIYVGRQVPLGAR